MSAQANAIQAQLKCNLKCTFLCVFMIGKCMLRCSFNAPSGALSIALTPSTFNAVLSSLVWNLRCAFRWSIECHLNFNFYWIILYTCNSSATWSAPFSAISGAHMHLYIDIQVWFQLYYQFHSKLYHQAHIKRIYRVVPFAHRCASLGALKTSLLLSFFNPSNSASVYTLKPIFESIPKCVPYTLSWLSC